MCPFVRVGSVPWLRRTLRLILAASLCGRFYLAGRSHQSQHRYPFTIYKVSPLYPPVAPLRGPLHMQTRLSNSDMEAINSLLQMAERIPGGCQNFHLKAGGLDLQTPRQLPT